MITLESRDLEVGKGLRIVDLCAGLGGFHLAVAETLARAGQCESSADYSDLAPRVECVLASDIEERLRLVYVRNFPAIELTYKRYHPLEDAAFCGLDLYDDAGRLVRIHGDLHQLVEVSEGSHGLRTWPAGTSLSGNTLVPDHDLLCAGFPCQPFSKSGTQLGFDDYRGTVFGSITIILEVKQPPFVILENVGNFERHDGGRTWRLVKETLAGLGYQVLATSHRLDGRCGHGLLSPHQLGFPHHRERFFAIAQHESVGVLDPERSPLLLDPRLAMAGPVRQRYLASMSSQSAERLYRILRASQLEARPEEIRAAQLSSHRVSCVNLWNELLAKVDGLGPFGANPLRPLPSSPIWGFELDPWNQYPFEERPPWEHSPDELLPVLRDRLKHVNGLPGPETVPSALSPARLFMATPVDEWGFEEICHWKNTWPSYAWRSRWPKWKVRFIAQNREFAHRLAEHLDPGWLRDWLERLYHLPPSLQKLEWNCQGEALDLWQHILQFRPSGLRAKRYQHVPALVAMTTTQVPIVPRPQGELRSGGHPGSRGRFLLPSEALQLQGFPSTWILPPTREAAFAALGNAIHVGLVAEVLRAWLRSSRAPQPANSPTEVPNQSSGVLQTSLPWGGSQ